MLSKIAASISRISSVENSILKSFLTSYKNDYGTTGGEWIISDSGSEYLLSLKKVTKNSIIIEAVNADDENDTQNYEISMTVKKI